MKRLLGVRIQTARFSALCAMLALALHASSAPLQTEPLGARPLQPVELHGRLHCTNAGGGPAFIEASAPAGAHLNYYGGRVLSNVKIVMVLYGGGPTNIYANFITNDAAPSMVSFYQQVVNSSYIDWLCEYGTGSQSIGRGSYAGKYIITPQAANDGSRITDSNIQSELARQVQMGALPASDENTLYMVHFPKGKTITLGRNNISCVTFCAYHSTVVFGGTTNRYAVLPDMSAGSGCAGGVCGGLSDPFGSQCSVASHELIESITDPDIGLATVFGPPLSWYDPTYGEVGDICNAMPTLLAGSDGFTYWVQTGFSDAANECIGSRPELLPMASSQSLISFQGAALPVALGGQDPNLCPRPLSYAITANPQHGALSGAAPNLTYMPAPTYSGTDSFQFSVNNGLLDSSPATVGLTLVSGTLSLAPLPDQNVSVTFAAVPNAPYEVQAADSLTNPVPWTTLFTTNSGTNAVLTFDDLFATNHAQRFYRTVSP